jgi:ADP-ribose pyrophosphatase
MLPKRLDRKILFTSPWINLCDDKVLMPSGKIIENYYQLDYLFESVVILLENSKKEICFIKSLRYSTQKEEWEIPAGGIEKNENVLMAAEREVKEETGFQTKALKLVYSFNPSNGVSNQTIHIVFGNIDEQNRPTDFDQDEVKEIHWFSTEKIKKLIAKNEIRDGVSLLPILLYLNGSVEL